MSAGPPRLRVDPSLRRYLAPRVRDTDVPLEVDVPLRHLVPAAGLPLTEVGALRVAGEEVGVDVRPRPGDVVVVEPVQRPQPVAAWRFLLDVHLGSLARRMRLLGIDVDYSNSADDDELAARAVAETRVLLTQDRGLLRRRVLAPDGGTTPVPDAGASSATAGAWSGHPARAADVLGRTAAEQLADGLDRFAPPLAPLTLCAHCGGALVPATKTEVADRLLPGTARTYDEFVRCTRCGKPFWRGAHADRLEELVREAGPGGHRLRPGPSWAS